MAEHVTLQAERRTLLGKAVRRLRKEGRLPGNIYGAKQESIPITISGHDIEQVFKAHGPATLFTLRITPDGAEETAVVRHVQREPKTGAMQHIDFMHIDRSQTLRAKIPVHLTGDAPAVTLESGVLLHPLDTIEIEARPEDLPQTILVDISGLTDIGATLHVSDVPLPRGVKSLTEGEKVLVTISAPRAAVVETTVPEELEATEEEEEAAEAEETNAPTDTTEAAAESDESSSDEKKKKDNG